MDIDINLETEIYELQRKARDYSQVIIRRSHLFKDAINQFKSLSLTSIYVKFDGESGDDFDGLTRELVSDFWKEFSKQFSDGQKCRYLNPTPTSYL